MSNTLVLWNRGSGRGDQIETVQKPFSGPRSRWLEMTRELDLSKEIEGAVDRGCTKLIAAGGDGTVNAAVNALMRLSPARRCSLAILPLGTANDFAGTLGVPDDLDEAVRVAQSSCCTPTDVVKIIGDGCRRYYANVAAGGNSVRVTEELSDDVKSLWGAFSYLRGAMNVLPDMRSYRITAECDGERFSLDSWAVLVANGRTNAGRIEVAPKASVDDGLLDVILIRDGQISDMVEMVARNLLGDFLACDQIIFRQVRRLRLDSQPPMRFTIDGEVIDEVPIEFEVVPGAIAMHRGAC